MMAVLAASPACAEDAHLFLNNILKTYGSSSTFYCEGTIVSTVRYVGGGKSVESKPAVDTVRFSAWYKRPYLFRMDWVTPEPRFKEDTAWSLYVGKDGQYVIDSPFRKPAGQIRYSERHRTLDDAINRSRRSSADLTYFIPKLLENKSTWFDINGCSFQGEEMVNSRLCHILAINNHRMGNWTLWADKETFAIYRFQKSSFLPESAMQSFTVHQETNPNAEPDINPPDMLMKGRSYLTTVNFTTAIFNKEMTDSDFYYTGPKAKGVKE